jgi:protoporphyrinogen oxidase
VGLYWEEKMYPFVTPGDLLRFKPLPFLDKIRTGLVALYLQKDKNWEKFEKVQATEWMEKWAGKNAYRVIWEPLLKGKFHERYEDVSMAWLWARIHTRVGSKNKKGHEELGYLNGGFGQITDRLAEEIKKNKGKIKLNYEIMDGHKGPSLQELEDEFDFILDTRPAKKVDYLGAIDVVFSSKQSISPYYWHNINDPNSPFLAFIQHTNLVDKKQYGGKNVYYMGAYVPQDHKYFKSTDKAIIKEFFDYLKKIFPDFKPEKVVEAKVFKMKYAQHIVDLKYRSKIPFYKQSEKVFNLNFAQIFPEDRGINYAVKEARKVEEMIR